MSELKFDGKRVSMTLAADIRSKRKLAEFKQLYTESPIDALKLLESMKGKAQRVQYKRLRTSGNDNLATKGKGTILNRLVDAKHNGSHHRPLLTKRGEWIGIEIECLVPIVNGARNRRERDNCYHCGAEDGYNDYDECNDCGDNYFGPSDDTTFQSMADKLHAVGVHRFHVKYDGSLRSISGYKGIEITLLCTMKNLEPLKKTCDLLERVGAKVNSSCGLHIHLDQRDLFQLKTENSAIRGTRTKLVEANTSAAKLRGKRLANAMDFFKLMMPSSRADNDYCRELINDFNGEGPRYCCVNMHSFDKFNTIEIRLHSGTTNYIKISNWISLLYIVQQSKKLTKSKLSFDNFYDVFGEYIEYNYLKNYVNDRIYKFNPQALPKNKDKKVVRKISQEEISLSETTSAVAA